MKKWAQVVGIIVIVAIAGVSVTSCYTLFNKNEKTRGVTFQSQDPGVEFELYKGEKLVAKGKTPYVVDLSSRFLNMSYTLKFKGSDGVEKTQNVKGKVAFSVMDFIFLSLDTIAIPFLVIDGLAASTKLWRMPAAIDLQMGDSASYTGGGEGQITFLSINDISPEMRSQLIPLEEGVDYHLVAQE